MGESGAGVVGRKLANGTLKAGRSRHGHSHSWEREGGWVAFFGLLHILYSWRISVQMNGVR